MEVRTRMAPSPTGNLHLGTAYATLWPYLFARHHNGKFLLRIEDTDRERSTQELADGIIEGLKWLGFDFDEGPFYQMERLELYQQAADQLLAEGKAYLCFCTKSELEDEKKLQVAAKLPQVYSGRCRNLTKKVVEGKKGQGLSYVIRYKLSEDRGVVEYEDLIHGQISFDSKLIGDFVIARQNGVPLYNFAVVVDDADMKITHVIRGDDHISNTPKQILLFEALGEELPKFGHYPVILEQDRSGKLSKRTGATGIEWYKHEGYLPEAIINYLALLGMSFPEDREIMTKIELIEYFDIKKMIDHAAAWNQDKLDWLNGEYIRAMSDDELEKRLSEYLVDHPSKDKLRPLIPLIKERIKKLSDFVPLTNFLFEGPEYEKKVFDSLKVDQPGAAVEKIVEKLEALARPWTSQEFGKTFRELAKELGISSSQMFQLIRVGFSGQLVTPPLFESMKYVGEDEAIKRVKLAVEFLQQ